jgi:hypothetical protein
LPAVIVPGRSSATAGPTGRRGRPGGAPRGSR